MQTETQQLDRPEVVAIGEQDLSGRVRSVIIRREPGKGQGPVNGSVEIEWVQDHDIFPTYASLNDLLGTLQTLTVRQHAEQRSTANPEHRVPCILSGLKVKLGQGARLYDAVWPVTGPPKTHTD